MKNLVLIVMAMSILTGCGSSGNNNSITSNLTASKGIFSVWTSVTPVAGKVFDLSKGVFGSSELMTYLFSTGNLCNCIANAIGTTTAGNYVFSRCSYENGTGTGSDPGCAALNDSGNYNISNNIMTACDSGGCVTYK